MKRYIHDSYQDTVKQPLPHSSPLLSPPLISSPARRPAVFWFHTGFYFPLQLSSSIYTSLLASNPYSSFVLFHSLPPVLSLFLYLLFLLVSRPPSTSFVEFRQAIYIFLPGCLTSHSLNKVCFIVFAGVYAHLDSVWACVCTCTATDWSVWVLVGVCMALSLFLFFFLMVYKWVCNRSKVWMPSFVSLLGLVFFLLCISFSWLRAFVCEWVHLKGAISDLRQRLAHSRWS